jgi:hypothetical protein
MIVTRLPYVSKHPSRPHVTQPLPSQTSPGSFGFVIKNISDHSVTRARSLPQSVQWHVESSDKRADACRAQVREAIDRGDDLYHSVAPCQP